MKARDIIPGWPRPRSVLVWNRDWDWHYLRYAWGIGSWYSRDGSLDVDGSDRWRKEFEANVAYHRAQQAMVNAHFEAWRRYEWQDDGLYRSKPSVHITEMPERT